MMLHATQAHAILITETAASAQVKKEIHVLAINLRMILVTRSDFQFIVILTTLRAEAIGAIQTRPACML